MPALEIAAPEGGRRVLTLEKGRVTIGRARENDLFLPDRWLSRHHAEIRLADGGYYVYDLGSKNGTLVNRIPVRESQRLHPGDIITLGEHSITFSDGESSAKMSSISSRRRRDCRRRTLGRSRYRLSSSASESRGSGSSGSS